MGSFIIRNSDLIAAAKEYETASDTYATQMDTLKNELESVTEQWKDEISEVWANLIPETITDLEKIKTNLTYNTRLLTDVAKKAEELQTTIKSEINKLYLNN